MFSDPRYADMSLDTKVTYTFLLNRFQISRRNGWVNDFGEVFIFPCRELTRELHVGEKRVTAAFQKLEALHLIWEKRCSRGDANQIYRFGGQVIIIREKPDSLDSVISKCH